MPSFENTSEINSNEKMKEETIKAVQEGRALPMPEFAAEEGGEMMAALEAEIEKLDPEQLSQFYRALKDAENATTIDIFKQTLTNKTSLLEHTGIMVLVIPFFLGTYLTGNPGVGVLVATGAGVGMSAIRVSNWTDEEKAVALEKVKRVEHLIEKTQEQQKKV